MNNDLSVKNRIYILRFILVLSIYFLIIPKSFAGTQIEAAKLNHKARASYVTGNYRKALLSYNEALRIDRSIENTDGVTVNLINLSIIYRKINDYENALKCVDEIFEHLLQEHRATLWLADAAIVKTLILIDTKEYDHAWDLIEKGLMFPTNKNTNTTGRLYNLKTRLAFMKDDTLPAISLGMKALQVNKQNDDEEETANSLRLLAEIKTKLKEYSTAKSYYKQALELDKSINASRKMSLDLIGLGNVSSINEKNVEASIYFQRALAICESNGDRENVEYLKKTLSELEITKD